MSRYALTSAHHYSYVLNMGSDSDLKFASSFYSSQMATKPPVVVVSVTAHILSLSSSMSPREFESVGADVAARLTEGASAGGKAAQRVGVVELN